MLFLVVMMVGGPSSGCCISGSDCCFPVALLMGRGQPRCIVLVVMMIVDCSDDVRI